MNGEPIFSITGERVALGPIRRDLLPTYTRWLNDFEVLRGLSVGFRPMTAEAEAAWYDGAATNTSGIQFTIYERESLRPIGNTGLNGIDHRHRTAEFGILIGETDCWHKGYGTETARLMLDYGFTLLGLHHIMLRVFNFNQWAIRAYERAGYTVCGRRRECIRLGDTAYDEIIMECLATEFDSPLLARLLPDN